MSTEHMAEAVRRLGVSRLHLTVIYFTIGCVVGDGDAAIFATSAIDGGISTALLITAAYQLSCVMKEAVRRLA